MEAVIRADAKINLSLDILGKLPNGYHSVEMVMQSIPLSDIVTIKTDFGDGIELCCNKGGVPNNEKNVAYRAADLFLKASGINSKIKIEIEKNIPVAAGMAGGSTDAAAVLKGLNEMFGRPLSQEKLLELCLKIGADVPFCLLGGCSVARGIGEVLTPISPLRKAYLVVAKPQFEVSTKWVYENLNLSKEKKRPDTNAVIFAIAGGDLKALADNTANVLESVTEAKYPVITEYKKLFRENGAILSMMSGSGPTVFGIFDSEENAKKAYGSAHVLTPDTFYLKI